jgi:hypothetical protein
MKTPILTLLLACAAAITSYAQCGKHLILSSSKTEYLDGRDSLQRTQEENSSIEISKTNVIIIPANDATRTMKGEIQSDSCQWNIPFKDGRSVIKLTMKNDQGETRNCTITIEGKAGIVTLYFEAVEMPDKKIRVPIDTFQEKK